MAHSDSDDELIFERLKDEFRALGPWPGVSEAHRPWLLNHGGRENLSWTELGAVLSREYPDEVTTEIWEAQILATKAYVRAGLARLEGSGPKQPPVAHGLQTITALSPAFQPRSSNNRSPSLQTTRANVRASISSRVRWSAADDRQLIALEQHNLSWKNVSCHFPGRTSGACKQRTIQIVGSGPRAARRAQAITNQSALARQTPVPGNHPVSTMPRTMVASSSQLPTALTPAHHIPPPIPTLDETSTVGSSLQPPDLASPVNLRTSQRPSPIRDLDLRTFPTLSSQPAVNLLQQERFQGLTNPPVYTMSKPPLLSGLCRLPPRPTQLTQNPTNPNTRQGHPDVTLTLQANTSTGLLLRAAERREGGSSNPSASRPQPDVPSEWSRQDVDLLMKLRERGNFWRAIADNFPGSTWYECKARYNMERTIREENRHQQPKRRRIGPTPTNSGYAPVTREPLFAEARCTPSYTSPPLRRHAHHVSSYLEASTERQVSGVSPLLIQEASRSSTASTAGARQPLPHITNVLQLEELDDEQFEQLIYPLRGLSAKTAHPDTSTSSNRILDAVPAGHRAVDALQYRHPDAFAAPESSYTAPRPPPLEAACYLPRPTLFAHHTGDASSRRDLPSSTLPPRATAPMDPLFDVAEMLEGGSLQPRSTANAPRRRRLPNLTTATATSTAQRPPSMQGSSRQQLYPFPSPYRTPSVYGQRRQSGLTLPAPEDTVQRVPTGPDLSRPLAASTAFQTGNVPRRRAPPGSTAPASSSVLRSERPASTMSIGEELNLWYDEIDRRARAGREARRRDLAGGYEGYGGGYGGGN